MEVSVETLADVLDRLGGIAPHRVLFRPTPGKATEKHLRRLHRSNRLFELIAGTIVEKVYSYPDSALTVDLIVLLNKHVCLNEQGAVAGVNGYMRLRPGVILSPAISFVPWGKLPGGMLPTEPYPDLHPEFAVEVPRDGNTKREMAWRREEYFRAGTRLVWFVDRRTRTVEVFTSPDLSTVHQEEDTLEGGDVLPDLRLSVREVFARMPKSEPRP